MTSTPTSGDPAPALRLATPASASPPGWVLRILVLLAISSGVSILAARNLNLGVVPGGIMGAAIFGVSFFAMLKLQGAPREMGFTFGLKFLSVTAYKILNITLVFWLASDFGYSKESALALIAGWSIVMTLTTLGITSPALSTNTVSPTRISLR